MNLDDLLHTDVIKTYSRGVVIAEVNKKAINGKSRFELVCKNGRDMIRASFGRNFRPVSNTCYALCQFSLSLNLIYYNHAVVVHPFSFPIPKEEY